LVYLGASLAKRKRAWWAAIGVFLGHVCIGTVAFAALCMASIGLSLRVQSIQADFKVPPLTLLVLTGLEQVILIVDAVLFALYPAVTAARALTEILK
jgi:hypothetical protein